MRNISAMIDHHPQDDPDVRAAIWERLSRSVLGLTTQDIARSIRQGVPDVSTVLLAMQRDGLVRFVQRRWRLTQSPAAPERVQFPTTGSPGQPAGGFPDGPRARSDARQPPAGQTQRDDEANDNNLIANSRWATFRRLCQYYAECVRLDQGTTIHGKDGDENVKFVCLSGNLNWPETTSAPEMSVPIPSGWSEFVQEAMKGAHLFLGAPLNRFQWRDPSARDDVVFVSPVFLAPVEFTLGVAFLTK